MVNSNELSALEPRLRELAAQLVSDPDQAEDVVQDAYLDALLLPPDRDRGLNGWLRRLLRAKALKASRHERKRKHYEEDLPESIADPSQNDVERRKQRFLHALAEELESLREPYRSTLRARFLEGLAPRHLARREDLPVRTIHTRTQRGLALLRDRLERRAGPPSWYSVLFALLGLGRPRRWAFRWATLGVVVVGTVWTLSVLVGDGPPDEVAAGQVSASFGTSPESPPGLFELAPVERAEGSPRVSLTIDSGTPDTAPEQGEPVVSAPNEVVVAGTVVDEDGAGVGGMDVVFEPGGLSPQGEEQLGFSFVASGERVQARSDDRGRFQMLLPKDESGRLIAKRPGYVTALAPLLFNEDSTSGHSVIVDRTRTLAGYVHDADGAPIAQAELTLRCPNRLLVEQQDRMSKWVPRTVHARSGTDGAFVMEGAFQMEAARLEVHAEGYQSSVVQLDTHEPLQVVLERVPQGIRGQLSYSDGTGVANGSICAGGRMVDVDEDGRFVLTSEHLAGDRFVWGFVPEYLPAKVDCSDHDPSTPLLLTIAEEALAIEGRVVDDQGQALANVSVWAIDPTLLGGSLTAWFAETHVRPDPKSGANYMVQTDEHGRFRLPYLLDRDYRLGALHPRTWVNGEVGPIAAGAGDVLIRVSPAISTAVDGVVVDSRGQPIPGARVQAQLPMIQALDAEGRAVRSPWLGPSTMTESDGTFRFASLPQGGFFLNAGAEGCFGASTPPLGSEREGVRIQLVHRARLEVLWPGGAVDGKTSFTVLDGEGDPVDSLPIESMDKSRGMLGRRRVELEPGVSSFVLVPDVVSEVVFLLDGHEVDRLPIDWSPDWTARVVL